MACIITISYQLAAHLPIYYFYNLRVSLTINVIHLCVVCGQVFPLLFLPSSRIRSRFLSLLFVAFFSVPVCSMEDCSCGCLAKMARIANDYVHESGLELTESQRAWATFLSAIQQPWVSCSLCLSPDGWGLGGIMGMCFYSFCRSHFESHGLNL